jgi:hypothetical protein
MKNTIDFDTKIAQLGIVISLAMLIIAGVGFVAIPIEETSIRDMIPYVAGLGGFNLAGCLSVLRALKKMPPG